MGTGSAAPVTAITTAAVLAVMIGIMRRRVGNGGRVVHGMRATVRGAIRSARDHRQRKDATQGRYGQ
jgi:hypothetical protein